VTRVTADWSSGQSARRHFDGRTHMALDRHFPALTREGVRAATAYAGELVRERIVALPGRSAA